MSIERKITVASGAGLIGQDLIPRLTARGYTCIVATDKHPANTATLARVNPGVEVIKADLARPGSCETALIGADTLVLNHAQIGALEEKALPRRQCPRKRESHCRDAARLGSARGPRQLVRCEREGSRLLN
jgi:nucleoside-diphosphate-sugar epimerase